MADEESIVFPAFEGTDPAGTERLRGEHREIDALTSRLSPSLDGTADPRPLVAENRVVARRSRAVRKSAATSWPCRSVFRPPILLVIGRGHRSRRARHVGPTP